MTYSLVLDDLVAPLVKETKFMISKLMVEDFNDFIKIKHHSVHMWQ